MGELWRTLFFSASCRDYNVGSDVDMTIATLVATVAHVFGRGTKGSIAWQVEPEQVPQRYVPCVRRALEDLRLRPIIDLQEAISRTIAWHRENAKPSVGK